MVKKQNSMVEANVQIIEELKAFLELAAEDKSIRILITQTEKDFTRNRKLTLARIVSLIINMPKRSLCIEIQEFFASLDTRLEPCTKGAFSLQRTKLHASFFEAWNNWLVSCFYYFYGEDVKYWRGFLIQAVDGSTAYLVDKKEVVDYFGTQVNQFGYIPMARVMQIQDILNDLTVRGTIRPIIESEQAIMNGWVYKLNKDSITLFDRGFTSFALMYLMNNEETPRNFVMRCKTTFNKDVLQFMNSSDTCRVIELMATPDAKKTLYKHGYIITSDTTTKVRMEKIILSTGEVEVLLTNLYDVELYTNADLKYLYGLRWGIETTYGKQKNQQQMEQFSGHRVICIQQDYAAGLFVANLQSIIEKQCDEYLSQVSKKRKYRYKINRNVSWASLKFNIIKLFLCNDPHQILIQLQKAFEKNIEPIRPGRQYPRIKKSKRLKGKYQTVTNYKRAI
jgi:hypothetical protein